MTIIILLRHGENEWVKEHRLAGWIPNVHLNEKGHQQANEAAQRLSVLPVKALYSSPVARCMETAAYVAQTCDLQAQPLDDLGEVRYGSWEGRKIKKLAKKKKWHAVQYYPSRLRFPGGGEALREVQFRMVQTLEALAQQHKDETIVVVSHADAIKLVLAHYLGVHMDLFQRIAVSPASVSVLFLAKNGAVRVLRMNDDGPLRPFPAPAEKKQEEDQKGSHGSAD
jgi:probable phosphoglycerate mutase